VRTAFITSLYELAQKDNRINLIVGDLGFGVVTDIAENLPDQFLNVGVAEQNMTGIAAGMAVSGKVVFTYSIGNFPTLRCLEQVRNDICYHNANVKIVTVGGGLAYGALGSTHHATEDLAIMRSLPNMAVVSPGDPIESGRLTPLVAEYPGPVYFRLGRAGEPEVHEKDIALELGKATKLRDGNDITLISTGSMLFNTMKTAEKLDNRGIHSRVLSMHTVKPLDINSIMDAVHDTGAIVTIEEHSVAGGLGGAVLEAISSRSKEVAVLRIGLPADSFISEVGKQEYLWDIYGLTAEKITENILDFIED
jgi:transketolase